MQSLAQPTEKSRLAIFMYGFTGGGVPRRNVTLANGLAAAGRPVDLIVLKADGGHRADVDPAVRVVDLGSWMTRLPIVRARHRRQFAAALPKLVRYLRENAPDILLAADNYANLTAVRARRLAGVDTKLILSQRNHATRSLHAKPRVISKIVATYPKADAIVAVSHGVANDLALLGVPGEMITTIYNPVIGSEFAAAAALEVSHPWFREPGPPVIVGAGRIGPQKNFEHLVRAFAQMRSEGVAGRLLILGGEERPGEQAALAKLASALGVGDDVSLPGVVPIAVPYFTRCRLFVLSSRWEGLPGVLIEALGCGLPIVSVDCPSGPSEVLDGGRYGRLAPVDDVMALAAEMKAELADPHPSDLLRDRANEFSVQRAVEQYEKLFLRIAAPIDCSLRNLVDSPRQTRSTSPATTAATSR